LEVEYKFALPDRSAGERVADDGLLSPFLGPIERIGMKSVYYDTPDGFLEKEKAGLRLRFENGSGVICLKLSHSESESGLSKREEYECPASSVSDGLYELPGAGAPAGLCERLAGGELIPVAEVSFLRIRREYRCDGLFFELCVDDGFFRGKYKDLPFCELEIELKKGDADRLSELVTAIRSRCRLIPEPRSKLARAKEHFEKDME